MTREALGKIISYFEVKAMIESLKPYLPNQESEESVLAAQLNQAKKQLAWYRSFFDNAADAVFVIQPGTWSVLDANDRAARLMGLDKSTVLGLTLPQFKSVNKLLVRTTAPTVLSDVLIVRMDEVQLHLEVNARFFEHDGQQLIQAIARDVTEQRALSEKLEHADKLLLLGQLSAGVAHEIRNPLAAINLNLQLLKRGLDPASPLNANVTTALQGVERIAHVVESTVDFARPSTPSFDPNSINDIALSALQLVQSNTKRQDVVIVTDFDDKIPMVSIDAKQIQQCFINLLTNGLDAIRGDGTITIRTFEEHADECHFVCVTISDTGRGISEEDMKRIFTLFFSRKPDGTGLGLPIAQRILHQHHATIDVESHVGVGSSFTIRFPVSRTS